MNMKIISINKYRVWRGIEPRTAYPQNRSHTIRPPDQLIKKHKLNHYTINPTEVTYYNKYIIAS
jgi:hypothetical protein